MRILKNWSKDKLAITSLVVIIVRLWRAYWLRLLRRMILDK